MKNDDISTTGEAEFTLYQERLHALVHVLGILFGVIAVPLLISNAQHKDIYSLFGITVYGICFLMVFTFSTLYHASLDRRIKKIYKKLDRISIYFLIAGTYTPLIKSYMFDFTGITMLYILWFLVIIGILFEIFFPDRFAVMSIAFYLSMGSVGLFAPYQFFASMPLNIAMLVLSGMILYVIGVAFYVWHKWEYHHVLWHIFVLSASICHYLAVLYTI